MAYPHPHEILFFTEAEDVQCVPSATVWSWKEPDVLTLFRERTQRVAELQGRDLSRG